MLFVFKETVVSYRFSFFTANATMIGNCALFISNDNFDTRFKNSLFNVFFVVHPVFGVGAHNVYFGIASESLRYLFNVLCKGGITKKVKIISRCRLMPCHCRRLIV